MKPEERAASIAAGARARQMMRHQRNVAKRDAARREGSPMSDTGPMPKPHTPPRSMRIPDPIWEASKRTAARKGETITDAVVRFLTVYGADELAEEQAAAKPPATG